MIGTTVGIDIRDEMVVAVAVRAGLRQQVVTGAATVPLTDEAGLAEALRAVCEQIGMSAGGCVAVMPFNRLSFRTVKMPFASVKKIGQTIAYELETMLPIPVDGLVADFVVSNRAPQPDVLAAVAGKEFLAEYLAQWQAAGVNPAVLEVRAVPLAGLLARENVAPDCGLLLDFVGTGGTMVLFAQGRIVLVRDLPGDGEMATEPARAEFCRSVLATIHSHRGGNGERLVPEVVFVTGPAAGAAGMAAALREGLGLPVTLVDLAARTSVRLTEAVAERWDGLSMDGALALALRGRRGAAGGFNFRKDAFAVDRPLHRFKREIIWGAAFAMAFVALVGANLGIEYYHLQRRSRDLDGRIKTIFSEALPQVTRIVDPVQQLRVRVNEMKRAAAGRANTWAEMSVLDFLQEISGRIPVTYTVRLSRMAVDPEGAIIKGETDNFNNVDGIKKGLAASPLFREVTISSANLDRTGSKVQFELRIQ
ncbi:MAG: PilN domain-containing protein [Desulfobulbaceae bacterium]|nr:PilN domain-containing protein [Desulfobulbaceae bacterium]